MEAEGLGFTGAQEYTVFPPPGPETPDGETAAAAARALARLMGEFEPDLVVSDILTLAPTLAAEVAGVPHATLIPHVYPVQEPGMPLYSLGFRPPRTPLGRAGWRATMPILGSGLRRGRDDLNRTRERLGLAPLERFHGGISELLAVVATFPQLEYPRRWPEDVRVSGPLFFELPTVRRRRFRRGRGRWWWWRRARRRIRSAGCCGWRWRRWRMSRCGCWRPPTGTGRRSRWRCRRTRCWCRGCGTRRRFRRPTR